MINMKLAGVWRVSLPDGTEQTARVPGTLDENGIGGPDRPEKQWHDEAKQGVAEDDFFGNHPIHTRFTRKFTWTGPACWTREIVLPREPEGRMILTVERSRKLSLTVNGEEAVPLLPGSVSTPWRFESRAFRKGGNSILLTCDNSYPGWPAGAILYSSAATDETQTNWNGLLGNITLEEKPPVFLLGLRLIPNREATRATIQADVSASEPWQGAKGTLRIACDALEMGEAELKSVSLRLGFQTLEIPDVPLRKEVRCWDLDDPWLYPLTAGLMSVNEVGTVTTNEFQTSIGIRSFGPDGKGRLSLNGRRLFLRSEANCAAFPETGHPPMELESWMEIIRRYQAYGVNCLRFHSHCPPENAFAAADRLGMLMQPELSHWDPDHAFESEESFAYYREELLEILRMLAPHPSFVMLTLGNELCCDETGRERMATLVRAARQTLPDRLYAWGSNAFYGRRGCDPDSDFYTAQKVQTTMIRAIGAASDQAHPDRKARVSGFLNNQYPDAKTNYDEGMDLLRESCSVPVFSFEVGQYEVLPDFHELADFHGVTEPVNYLLIRRRAEKRGMLPLWDRMVEATGELALIGYRAEVEAVMRTPGMSGISLLSLQDFPGQGTALVGMMNAHLRPKAYDFARPERFQAFFRDSMPLLELEKYTYTGGETLRAALRSVHYGKAALNGCLRLVLRGEDGTKLYEEQVPDFRAPAGESVIVREVSVTLPKPEKPMAARWTLALEGHEEEYRNEVRIWIYPEACRETPADVRTSSSLTPEDLAWLSQGGKLLLEPPSEEEALPGSIRGQFSTDFWSVGTFPQQEGGMGLLIQADHPLFASFPTSFHTDYQWWLMAGQRALRLPNEELAGGILIRQMDSYAQLRTFAMLLEARVGSGRVLISSMGLNDLPDRPEVRALRSAIREYMASDHFQPKVSLSPEHLVSLFSPVPH